MNNESLTDKKYEKGYRIGFLKDIWRIGGGGFHLATNLLRFGGRLHSKTDGGDGKRAALWGRADSPCDKPATLTGDRGSGEILLGLVRSYRDYRIGIGEI